MNQKIKKKIIPNQLFARSIVQHFASSVCLFRPRDRILLLPVSRTARYLDLSSLLIDLLASVSWIVRPMIH